MVIARDGNKTVLIMANDFQAELKYFALFVPVPTVIKEEEVRVAEPKIIQRLDTFSTPRLVESFNGDSCTPAYKTRDIPVLMAAAIRESTE